MASWAKAKTIEGNMSITGALWVRKGWSDVLKRVHVMVNPHEQWTRYFPFTASGLRGVFRPDLTRIENAQGAAIKERTAPREAFAGHTAETPWDELHLGYFCGYAIWNYLCTPFFFRQPGFQTEEIEPTFELGERKRRLKVTFPPSFATHCPEQVFHVDDNGMISRLDYTAPLASSVAIAHYMSDYRNIDGVEIATKRRAYRLNADGSTNCSIETVAIDILDITIDQNHTPVERLANNLDKNQNGRSF